MPPISFLSRIQDPGSRIRHNTAFCFLLALVLIFGCTSADQEILLSGRTMGTTYQVKAYGRSGISAEALAKKIALRLEQLNDVFSTYRSDSEISRFNRFDRAGEPFRVSEDFIRVMKTAREIHRLTRGAWDGTVDPLVRLWGFHDKKIPKTPPPPELIADQRRRVDFRLIEVGSNKSIVKRRADISLDLASIAKGYAVDQIAVLLRGAGIDRHLVEIGGEVLAAGAKPDGSTWKVGINRPEAASALDSIYRVVALTDRALATSGNYRNYFVRDGTVYTHVIDPRSGMPVDTGVVSASVLAKSCVFADGLATALMVLAPAEGLRIVEQLEGVECMLVIRSADGQLTDRLSTGFPRP
jgi:thiamine biosynthesis lipoprotein